MLMHSLLSWWSSLETISALSTVLKCTGAAIGVLILVFGFRESALRGRAQAAEKGRWIQELKDTRERADEAVTKQQPRLLSVRQAEVITKSLHSVTQTVPIVVASRMMDAESLAYGRQILEAIQKAGWQAEHTELSSHTFSGIAIFFNPAEASDQCQIVRSAFTAAGIPFSTDYLDVKRTPIQIDNAVYVIVGNK
jgi:hypothetical protein